MEGNNHDLDELFFKKLSGSITAAEEIYLQEQLKDSEQNRDAFQETQKLWLASADLKIQRTSQHDERWHKLHVGIERRTALFASRRVFLRYAAGLTLISILFGIYFFKTSPNIIEVRTQFGETKSLTLPDHSKVVLNSGTLLSYDESSWGDDERKLTLNGEAFFEVEKDKAPFIISANGTVVRVLGTSFNVRSRNDITAVSCITGKVRFSKRDMTTELTKGRGATITGDILSDVYSVTDDRSLLWMTGDLSFDNTPLKEVFAEVERHFNASVTIKRQLGTLTFTGKFIKPTLRNVIETVCLSAGLEYKINNQEVTIE